jgi:predicted DCC family thiol-disulfide oxidoreductase YuxK
MTRPDPTPLTVYYDGQCPLCRREIAFYQRLDRKGAIRWHDISRDAGDLVYDGIDRQTALDRIHARRPDGTIVTGAAAFVAMWERLPGFACAAPVARTRPALALLERGYAWFAPRRNRISQWLSAERPGAGRGGGGEERSGRA